MSAASIGIHRPTDHVADHDRVHPHLDERSIERVQFVVAANTQRATAAEPAMPSPSVNASPRRQSRSIEFALAPELHEPLRRSRRGRARAQIRNGVRRQCVDGPQADRSADPVRRARLAHEIVARHDEVDPLLVAGPIRHRGRGDAAATRRVRCRFLRSTPGSHTRPRFHRAADGRPAARTSRRGNPCARGAAATPHRVATTACGPPPETDRASTPPIARHLSVRADELQAQRV